MKRIIEHEESLNVVRQKCIKRNTDFKGEELTHLNLAFMELQKSYGKKIATPIDLSCSSCVHTAMNAVHNYIVNEEQPELSDEQTEDILMGMVIDKLSLELELEEVPEEKPFFNAIEQLHTLTLSELREMYPHIKARSVEKFIERLNA